MGRFVWRRQLIQWSRQSFIFAGTVGKLPEPAATVDASPAANGKPGPSFRCLYRQRFGERDQARHNIRRPTKWSPNIFSFVFGLGLGDFLYDLITKTGAKVVVVIEPNPDFLHYAAQVVDWAPILNLTASSQACDIRFITSSELTTAVAATMKSIIRVTCPPAWDGAMFYRHYDNGLLSRIWKDFNRAASSTAMLGLGFFEDELRMVSQTAENFLCGNVKSFQSQCRIKTTLRFS